MIHLAITCPKCGETHIYRIHLFGANIFQIGDFVDKPENSYSKENLIQCFDCNALFRIYVLVDEGRLVNILMNPGRKDLELIENLIFKKLDNYPLYYKPDYMKECLYGEVTNVIPSQFSTNSSLLKKKILLLFGLKWSVDDGYKVFDKEENLITRIYKIVSENFDERLLVMRDNCFPVLRDVDWDVTSVTDVETKLKKFVIPKDCDLVISSF